MNLSYCRRGSPNERKGVAILLVVAILAGLLALAAPFALSMALYSKVSRGHMESVRARLAAEGAISYAVSELHKTIDVNERYMMQPAPWNTPDWDTVDEFRISLARLAGIPRIQALGIRFDDPKDLQWSVRVEDEQGKINVHTAPPPLIGNLLGSAILIADYEPGAETLEVEDAEVFRHDGDPQTWDGFVRVGRETAAYRHAAGRTLTIAPDHLARRHPEGELVYDARADAIADYKFVQGRKTFRPFRSIYEIKAVSDKDRSLSLRADEFARIERLITVCSLRDRGPQWGRQERVLSAVQDDRQQFVVEDATGFGPGSVVRFVKDGKALTFGRVLDVVASNPMSPRRSFIRLDREIGVSAGGGGGQGQGDDVFVEPEIRHPVNVNTAPVEVLAAVFTGVALRGNVRAVSRNNALKLAVWLVSSRPVIRGPADLEQILRAACSANIIETHERDALIANASEAGTWKLRLSTTTFCYKSLGSFTVEGTGTVNTPAGTRVARTTLRHLVTLPQPPPGDFLLRSQKDFLRFMERPASHRVTSFPRTLFSPQAQPDESAKDGIGDVRLDTARVYDRTPHATWVDHFERQEPAIRPDGLDLRKAGPPPINADKALRYDSNGFLQPTALEFWIKPLGWGSCEILSIGDGTDRNRASVYYDGRNKEFVVEMADRTMEGRTAALRFPWIVQNSDWLHVAVSFRGCGYQGQEIRIDGQFEGEKEMRFTPGSRLAAAVDAEAATIEVEDASDFPSSGAVRIEQEIIEYDSKGGNSLNVVNRGARYSYAAPHAEGAFVEIYGYVNGLAEDLTPGGAKLEDDVDRNMTCRINKPRDPNKPNDQGGIKATDTVIPVDDATRMPKSGFVNVGGELCYYKDRSATELRGVERGVDGTTPRDHGDRTGISCISLPASQAAGYKSASGGGRGGIVQINGSGDETKVEWIEYGRIVSRDGKHYFLAPYSVRPVPGNPGVMVIWVGGFRGVYSTPVLAHDKGAKLIPVVRVQGPQCGHHCDSSSNRRIRLKASPYGEEANPVTVMDETDQGELRWVKRGYYHVYPIYEPNPPPGRRARIIDWGMEFYVGLDDFVKRTYAAARGSGAATGGRLMKFPTGEMPHNARNVSFFAEGGAMGSRGSGILDEVKFSSGPFAGPCRSAVTTAGQALSASDKELAVIGRNVPKSGLARIGDELVFYRDSGTVSVTRYFDPLPKLEDKAAVDPPKTASEQATVLRKLVRGAFGTHASEHGEGAAVQILDCTGVTALSAPLSAADDSFSVIDGSHFGPEGYCRIGPEVLSWCRGGGRTFSGIRNFRGRFGTPAGSFDAGEIVQPIPFRYWDRYAPEYAGEGLAFYQCGHSEPDAVWTSVLLAAVGPEGMPPPGLVVPRILVRFDGFPDWDSKPTNQPGGIYEFKGEGEFPLAGGEGTRRGARGVKADQIEIRVFWQFLRGAYYPNNDWKRTFGVDWLAATYYHPMVVHRREVVER